MVRREERPDEQYTAKDVRELADLSYRQLNEWDGKGALPVTGREDGKWRRFTPREAFVIMVCAELKKNLGVPLDSIKYVRDFMLQDGADHLSAAARLMSLLGVPVLLITDFKSMFVMDSVLEWIDLMQHGYFGGDDEGAYAMLKVNPIVNRVLTCLKEPIHIPDHGRGYEILREINSNLGVRDEAERKILELIRSKEFRRVEVELRGERVHVIRSERDVTDLTAEGIRGLIRDGKYETITLTKADGQVVRAVRNIAFKPDESTGRDAAEGSRASEEQTE